MGHVGRFPAQERGFRSSLAGVGVCHLGGGCERLMIFSKIYRRNPLFVQNWADVPENSPVFRQLWLVGYDCT